MTNGAPNKAVTALIGRVASILGNCETVSKRSIKIPPMRIMRGINNK
jgi:hypothetical protein